MTIDDDTRHPAVTHSAAAAQEIRAFNHATLMVDSIPQPATVYQALGELYTLAGYLNQAYDQLARALTVQLETALLDDDTGGDPAMAVMTACEHLEHAKQASQVVYSELTAAQNAIATVYVR